MFSSFSLFRAQCCRGKFLSLAVKVSELASLNRPHRLHIIIKPRPMVHYCQTPMPIDESNRPILHCKLLQKGPPELIVKLVSRCYTGL